MAIPKHDDLILKYAQSRCGFLTIKAPLTLIHVQCRSFYAALETHAYMRSNDNARLATSRVLLSRIATHVE